MGDSDPSLFVTTASPDSRQVSINWLKVKNPEKYRFALYRANRNEKTISLVKEINSGVSQVLETGLNPPLSNYYYFIRHVDLNGSLDPFVVFPNGYQISDASMANQLSTISYDNSYQFNQYLVDLYPGDAIPGQSTQGVSAVSYASGSETPPAARSQKLNEGIYIGLEFFSDKVEAVPSLISLDPAGRREIIERLNLNYTRSRTSGTALYYAEHTALEALTILDKAGSLPDKLDSVNIVTFTEGFDTSSTDVTFPAIGGTSFAGRPVSSYMTYISQQIKTRRFAGKKAEAFAIGIPGRGGAEASLMLESIASSDENVIRMNDVAQIEDKLGLIAERISASAYDVKLNFATPAYPVGTSVRITFDGAGPEMAARYIEGRVSYSNNAYSLTALNAQGLNVTEKSSLQGGRTGFGIEYAVSLNDVFDESRLELWYKQPRYANGEWQQGSGFNVKKSIDFLNNRKSVIICFLLDRSSSLSEYQIEAVREAVIRFIDKIYMAASNERQVFAVEIPREFPPAAALPGAEEKYAPPAAQSTKLQVQPAPPVQQYTRQPQYTPPTQYTPAVQQPLPPPQFETRYTVPSPEPVRIDVYEAAPVQREIPYQYYIERASPVTLYLPAPTVKPDEPYSGFWVQVGSFSEVKYAQDAWRKLFLSNCLNTEIFSKNINDRTYYRLKVGPYQDRRDAEFALEALRSADIGFNDSFIVKQ